ncbi:MAG TPA: hypothetical protein VHO06_06215 [Polyangia bacterium]|nr:hypothetical protein [Polyangia bacterium]
MTIGGIMTCDVPGCGRAFCCSTLTGRTLEDVAQSFFGWHFFESVLCSAHSRKFYPDMFEEYGYVGDYLDGRRGVFDRLGDPVDQLLDELEGVRRTPLSPGEAAELVPVLAAFPELLASGEG